jgi:hypothetical protein
METMKKFLIVPFFLAICIPANGEVLIYKKTIKGIDCDALDEQWEILEKNNRGYLVLEVTYDYGEEEETIDIVNAVQIDYFKDGQDKWYEVDEHSFGIIRADYNGKVLWILTESQIDQGVGIEILMLRGPAVDSKIGLGKDEPREIPKRLQGNNLSDQHLSLSHVIDTWSILLRLHSQWTKIANNPKRMNGNFDDVVADIKVGLIDKGYEEL